MGSDSSGLGGDLELCISNKLSGEADAAGPPTTLEVARYRL